ncbi:MAG: hypothetical protein HKN92_07255 [Chitinophagales bacterium]|nr:hypothetical protein [Chitinophagales bacterium]
MRTFTFKPIIACLITLMLLSSCYSAKQQYQSGNYERAIILATKKLKKNSNKRKQAEILEKAYKATVEKDMAAIEYLKIEGSPDNWIEIHQRYDRIERVMSIVKPLLPLYLKKEMRYIDVQLVNVNEERAQAKIKAAEYLYADANRLLSSNYKTEIRKSYYKFHEVKKLFPTYKDVDNKINEAYNKGQEFVLISITNNSSQVIPKSAFDQIGKMPTAQFNSDWVKYKTSKDGSDFSKRIDVVIERVDIGPEQIVEKNFSYEKDIEDGWQYQLDGNGNVVKDTSGNDVKIPVIRRVTADVLQSRQYKEGVISGSFRIFDVANNQMIQNRQFSEGFGFENRFMVMKGDKRAVPKDIITKIGGGPLPFPTNERMLSDAFQVIKGKLHGFIDQEINAVIDYSAKN